MGFLANFLRNNFRPGEPIRNFCAPRQHNRIANILCDLQGIGCRVLKPVNADGRGWRILIDGTSDIPPPTDLPSGAQPYHLQPYRVTSTSVAVRGGTLETFCHGYRTAVNLTCDGGASADMTNVKTLSTGGLSNGTVYIIITKDDALTPTTLTASLSNTAPTAADKTNRLIGHFTLAASVISGSVIPDWNGGNIREFWLAPDGYSLDYDSSANCVLEIKGWKNATNTTPWPADGEIMGRPFGHGVGAAPFWSSVYDGVDSISDWTGITINGATITGGTGPWPTTWAALTDTVGDPTSAANVGLVPVVTDQGASAFKLQLCDGTDSATKLLIPLDGGGNLECYAYHGRLVDSRPA